MNIKHSLALAATFALTACATTPPPITKADAAPAPQRDTTAFNRDRTAILAMAGDYRVDFDFRETVALAANYKLHEPHHSGATEWVNVIEDRGDFISLQHILVMGDDDDRHVIKHWRQDWQYEPAQIVSFRGEEQWERVDIAAEDRTGAWSQIVYHVDDSPRYGGTGRWTHDGAVATWTSAPTWRPLPRREYTTRSDYQVLDVINRHIVTPAGWVHEQDNTKRILAADGSITPLAKELGVNTYTRITDHDFTAGRDYWQRTAPFWREVRAAWDARLWRGPASLAMFETVDDDLLYERMFALANARSFDAAQVRADVDRELRRFERAP
ncbi:DUF6607 family protein [Chiayiivirga flava]|uniref:Uncharacterized protein n=1 Tax=Chiayiivirga flava TaxID=659595 RepID=A0A7W8G1F3_9GAMM|nr:DUF6607 family protein [Chiayiivirga flava]MBB5208808.1 hypothetical protein [Chiayiivirga flava]